MSLFYHLMGYYPKKAGEVCEIISASALGIVKTLSITSSLKERVAGYSGILVETSQNGHLDVKIENLLIR